LGFFFVANIQTHDTGVQLKKEPGEHLPAGPSLGRKPQSVGATPLNTIGSLGRVTQVTARGKRLPAPRRDNLLSTGARPHTGPMCGRSTYALTWEEIVRLYRLTLDQPARNTRARYNVCPTTTIDTIVGANGKRSTIPI
jgi:hypothetical protein